MADSVWIRIGAIDAHLDARTINSIVKESLHRKAESVTKRPEVRQAVGQAFVDAVTPFVPMKSGQLRESGRATPDGRLYWTATNKGFNYASTVYDQDGEMWPDGNYKKPSTSGTHPRWVEKVQPGTVEWDAFVNSITDTIKEAFRNE